LINEAAKDKGPEAFASLGTVINRLPIDQQKIFYRDYFNSLKNSGKFEDALKLLSGSGKPFLRTFEYMTMVKEFPLLNDSPALLVYFAFILELGGLNDAESIELAQLAIKKGKLEILRRWLDDNKVHCSEHLGDLVFDSDIALASIIYERAQIEHKIFLCAAASGNMELVKALQGSTNVTSDVFIKCLNTISKHHPSKLQSFVQLSCKASSNCANKDIFMALLKLEGVEKKEIARLLNDLSDALLSVNDSDVNMKTLTFIIENDTENLVPFLGKTVPKIQIDYESLMQRLKDECLNVAAFLISGSASEAVLFVDSVIEANLVPSALRMPSSEIVKLIVNLADEDPEKYVEFSAILCRFIEPEQYNIIRPLVLDHIDDHQLKFEILFSWVHQSKDKDLTIQFFNCAIECEKWREIENICAEANIQDPESIFPLLSVLVMQLHMFYHFRARSTVWQHLIYWQVALIWN